MLINSCYIGGESNNLVTSITTVRMLIRELEKSLHGKEDDFITIMSDKNREYIIESIKRVSDHSCVDEYSSHLTLQIRDGGQGNIRR